MSADDEAAARLLNAHRELYRAMLAGRTDRLGPLLDDGYTLTHMTGYVQPKREWLAAIDAGDMRYHAARETSVTVDVKGDRAVVVGKSVVTATIWGGRGTWNLQLTTTYRRSADGWVAVGTVATTF
jgi:hypothetical protein